MTPKQIATGAAATLFFVCTWGTAFAQPDAAAPTVASGPRGPIEIVVWNIRKTAGYVRVSICPRVSFGTIHKGCPYKGEALAHAGVTTVIVPDVPAGTYAAEVYQDEDDRDALKRGPLGVPLEGVGFSNDAPIDLRPPRFNDAQFDYDPSAPLALRIKLRYFPNL